MQIFRLIRNVSLTLSFLLVIVAAYGQNAIILRGKVIDQATKEPLMATTIVEINKNERTVNGTVSDFNGDYSLKLSAKNAMLRFSAIGYKAITIEYKGQQTLDVSLEPDVVSLGEVNVVAKAAKTANDGYMNILKKDQVGAIAGIELVELESVQATSVAEAIQGRISGVDIASASGDPGSGIKIQVRGASSIMGNSKPLVIVDGLPYQTTSMEDFNFSTESVEDYSSLLDVPVENIKDIQVLKDAATAAIYGSKAGNGVILITTKGGKKGRPKFTYNYKMAIAQQPKPIPLLNGDQYSTLMLESVFNADNGLGFTKPVELSYDPDYELYKEYSQNTDWLGGVSRTGYTQNHNLSVSGGGENTQYFISAGYTSEEGTTIGTSLDRLSTSMKLNYKMTRKVNIQSSFAYTHSDINNNGTGEPVRGQRKSVRQMAIMKAPNMSIYSFDENGELTDNYFSPQESFQGAGSQYFNPVAMAYESMANTLSERLRTSINVKYDINKDINWTSYVVYDVNNKEIREFTPQEVYGSSFSSSNSNKMSHNNGKSYDFQGRTTFLYKTRSAESNFFASVFGGEASQYPVKLTSTVSADVNITNSATFKGEASNAASNTLNDFFIASRLKNIKSSENLRRTLSGTGSMHLNVFGKYLLQGTLRADGDSKFGQDKKWGIFPAFGMGWIISEEGFISPVSWINHLKMRASYGINGNMPSSNDAFYSRYGANGSYYNINGIQLENIQLSSLNWEKTFQSDIGLEGSLFNNRLNFDAEYYYKRTEDIIIPKIGIPSSTGIGQLEFANFGEILNQGWEINGSVKVLVNKGDGLNVDVNFNVSNNINEVLSIPEGYEISSGKMNQNGTYLEQVEVGRPMGSFYGYKFKGVFARNEDNVLRDDNGNIIYEEDGITPRRLRFGGPNGYLFEGGDAIYEDVNKDGVIDEGDVVYLGNADPDLFGGFGLNLSYRGFYVNPYFHYVIGQDVMNMTKMNLESMYTRDNQSTAVLRRWRKQGDETDMPRALYNKGYNYLGSDRFTEDASFVRFKTLSIGYRFTKAQLRRLKISELNVFCNLYNLYTWTNYTGQDPEVGRSLSVKFNDDGSTEFKGGKDNAKTPPSRNITFGLIVGF